MLDFWALDLPTDHLWKDLKKGRLGRALQNKAGYTEQLMQQAKQEKLLGDEQETTKTIISARQTIRQIVQEVKDLSVHEKWKGKGQAAGTRQKIWGVTPKKGFEFWKAQLPVRLMKSGCLDMLRKVHGFSEQRVL